MKFYLDSADAAQWSLPAGCPPVVGVTTNPTLVMQAGLPVSLAGYLKLVAQAGEARIPELMLQLPRADVGEAAQWLEVLLPAAVQARVRLTIKLPCHPDWQPVLREVQAWGVPTLCDHGKGLSTQYTVRGGWLWLFSPWRSCACDQAWTCSVVMSPNTFCQTAR